MAFLNWWAGKQQEEPEESQLDIFGGSQALAPYERVDGAIINKDLNKEIKAKGGSAKAYPKVAEAITQEMFDMGSKDLYSVTGGRVNDRSTLPKEAQEAFIAAELRATHDLKGKDISGNQQQRDHQIVESARESTQETRSWWSLW